MANQHTGGKWNIYDEHIKKILNENEEIEPIDVVKKIGLELDVYGRQALSKYIRRNRNRILDKNEGVYEACDDVDVDFTSAKNLWIKTKNKDGSGVSAFVVNPNYVAPIIEEEIEKEIDFLSIFKDSITPVETITRVMFSKSTTLFDRLVYTDVHVGMNVNPDGFSLYGGIWNEEEIFRRQDIMVEHTINHQKSTVLHIDELGDFVDGWDGETTRKGQ